MIKKFLKKQLSFPLIVLSAEMSLLMSVIAPYGFNAVAWFGGFVFWLCAFHSGYVLNHLGVIGTSVIFRRFFAIQRPHRWYVVFVSFFSALIISLPLSLLLLCYAEWFADIDLVWQKLYFQCLTWNFFILFGYGVWIQKKAPQQNLNRSLVWSILLGTITLKELFMPANPSQLRADMDDEIKLPVRMKALLPYKLKFSKDIIYLQADDHYMYIQTEMGKAHIRLRLKDAMAMLDSVSENSIGMQVHRSYWVNFNYIKTSTTKELVLISGEKIPLSRYRRAEFLEKLQARQAPTRED